MTSYILSFVAVAAALAYWVRHAGVDAPSLPASVIKTLSTASLALLGLVIGAPGWIIAGLALGSLGDLALSRPGDRAFLAGMIAFALGHFAYVVEFGSLIDIANTGYPAAFWVTLAAMIVLIPLTALWIAPQAGTFAMPVRAYGVVIALMALSASLLPDSAGRWLVQLGVGSFVASDLILALRLFVMQSARPRLWAARSLWPLYWGGQALILAGSVA